MILLVALLVSAASGTPEKKAETCAVKPFTFGMPGSAPKPVVEAKKPAPPVKPVQQAKPKSVQQAQAKPAPKPKADDCLKAKPKAG